MIPSTPHSLNERSGVARSTLIWLTAAVGAAALWASTFTVNEGEVAVVARFGDPSRLVDSPGLQFKWPAPVDTVYRIDMRTHVLDPDVEEFLTQDQKPVEIDAFVAWRVTEPKTYLTSLRDKEGAENRIGELTQSALREVLLRGPLEDLISVEERDRDIAAVREDLKVAVAARCNAASYGVEIELVGLERVTFPEENKAAVERTMSAQRQQVATGFRVEGRERANEIETDARKQEAEIDASASETALRLRGEGTAEAKRIEQDMMNQNAELFALMQDLEIAERTFRGGLIILSESHPLSRIFARAAEALSAPKADTTGQ